jgi:predicted RNA-binding Zn-ribbon protein involved in translation (DUF1610 family)
MVNEMLKNMVNKMLSSSSLHVTPLDDRQALTVLVMDRWFWRIDELEGALGASHNRHMANSIWTTEFFNCPNCGLPYIATREQHPNKHSGSFSCEVCRSKVHSWSGNYDFFDWRADQVKSPQFGKRWG